MIDSAFLGAGPAFGDAQGTLARTVELDWHQARAATSLRARFPSGAGTSWPQRIDTRYFVEAGAR